MWGMAFNGIVFMVTIMDELALLRELVAQRVVEGARRDGRVGKAG